MAVWLVDADTLAGSRFVVSPLSETSAALSVLERAAAAHPGERAWLDAHLPAYRARLAADPITALLVRCALGHRWVADFATPPPDDVPAGFAAEVAAVRNTPPDVARADVAVTLGGPLPDALRRDDLPHRMAGLLEWVWTHTVAPTWPRRRRVLEADVVARTEQAGRIGWASMLGGLRPGTAWEGDGRLRINAADYPPLDIAGGRLVFVPVTHDSRWVAWVRDGPGQRYAVVYPCSGALAEGGASRAPRALERLLGPGRATVLTLLATPKSTTQLIALTGQGLGSVGRHLKILREAGLAGRRRAGRSVLYHRTAAGDMLVDAARPDEETPPYPS